ncbi:hypothetical protein BJX99DRAFT_229566 [Aspergillus californicus]
MQTIRSSQSLVYTRRLNILRPSLTSVSPFRASDRESRFIYSTSELAIHVGHRQGIMSLCGIGCLLIMPADVVSLQWSL